MSRSASDRRLRILSDLTAGKILTERKFSMNPIEAIDAEISRLTTAKNILLNGNGHKQKHRRLSPEGRKKISESMKKRWAERRKAKR